jgi:ATP-dependent Lon protease
MNDKMSRQFQNQLLNILDSGRIKVYQQRRSYDFEIKATKVFATCNEINRLSRPLQSRLRRLHLPPYTKEQFLDIAVKVCPKLKEEISRIIGEEVWKTSKDVRDVVSLSKLIRKSDGPDEIDGIMRTFTKYGSPT